MADPAVALIYMKFLTNDELRTTWMTQLVNIRSLPQAVTL